PSFFQAPTAPPSSLRELKSLVGVSSVDDLAFLTGDSLSKIRAIRDHLILVKKSLVRQISDAINLQGKLVIAEQLEQLSLDFSTTLVSWSMLALLPVPSHEPIELALDLLKEAKTILKAAQTIYKISGGCSERKKQNKERFNACEEREKNLQGFNDKQPCVASV
ncbi:MAG: hypothetical protein ACOYKA_00515, partial [Legionellaceae bacterium]